MDFDSETAAKREAGQLEMGFSNEEKSANSKTMFGMVGRRHLWQ